MLGEDGVLGVQVQAAVGGGAEPAVQAEPGADAVAQVDGGHVGELHDGGEGSAEGGVEFGPEVLAGRVVEGEAAAGVHGVQADQADAVAVGGDGQ